MKSQKSIEFIWRASSSLPAAESELLAHVWESYYCYPLPTYAFEWGPGKGAKVPNQDNIMELSQGLAKIAKQRAGWFSNGGHVVIPWGCDYQYQNAELVFRSTDWLIETINKHPEWGVHVQYATPTEYLTALRSANASFPVKPPGSSFFPYVTGTGRGTSSWSGYYTSRPTLKGLSTQAHAAMHAAELLYALSPASGGEAQGSMWALLETARRHAGIVQHHDAITGTECSYKEGCAGTDQVVGPHDVLGDYQRMLEAAIAAAQRVSSQLIADSFAMANTSVSQDEAALGMRLMGGA